MHIDDIPALKNAILKALKNGNNPLVVEQLEALQKWKATTDSLKSTRIGVFVTDLRKHEQANDDIKQASKNCVAKWKADIGKSSTDHPTVNTAASSKTLISKSATSATLKKSPSSASVNEKQASSNEVSTQSVIERNVKIDEIQIGAGLNDKVRVKCSEVLYSALASGTDVPAKVVAKVVARVEQVVFDHFTAASDQYKSKLRTLLRDKGNPNLRIRVLGGEIAPEKFGLMTAEELMSEDRQALVNEVQKANMEEALTQKPVHSATDIFKCGKCKGRKTTYYQMQTRSADEPMTTFVTCLICDNRWKFC